MTVVILPLCLVVAGLFLLSGVRRRSVGESIVLDDDAGGAMANGRGETARPSATGRDQRALVEAIASWTENLRDAVTASRGVEQAIIASADHCPALLRDQVACLVANLRYSNLDRSMRAFAAQVDHPTCDFVAAALVTASGGAARDVAGLLGHLAECARDESEVHLRVWVSRARVRTSVRIVIGSVVAFICGLVVLQPGYLAPFFSGAGLVALSACCAMFIGAIRWMTLISRVTGPGRFLVPRSGT